MKPLLLCAEGGCQISGATIFDHLDELSDKLLIEATKPEDMLLDLNQISDCDSAFVALLTACLQIKKQQKKSIVVTNSPQKLLAMLDVYNLKDSGFQVTTR